MADSAEIDTLDRQSRASEVLTVTIIMLCLSTVFVVLRLISRFGIVKRISYDDYAIMLAWVGDFTAQKPPNQRRKLMDSSSSRSVSPFPSATALP